MRKFIRHWSEKLNELQSKAAADEDVQNCTALQEGSQQAATVSWHCTKDLEKVAPA